VHGVAALLDLIGTEKQYGFDITRRTSDFRLDLFPGHRIVPYVAFSRNGGRGDGTINYILQSNEYTVPTNYSDYTNEYRAGVRFEFNHWHLTLEQGGYTSQNNQSLHSSGPVPDPGNVLTPILGQQLFLTSGSQLYAVRGDGLFSRALFTASPVSWADVSAQFLYSQPHMTANFAQANLGNFIDLAIPAFFGSESSVIDALAKQPHPAGSASVELPCAIVPGISWQICASVPPAVGSGSRPRQEHDADLLAAGL